MALNSTDKRKIDKIITEKINEYKKETEAKEKTKKEKKIEELKKDPPKELTETKEKIEKISKELEKLKEEANKKFEGWKIETAYGEEKFKIELTRDNTYIGNQLVSNYGHPEIVKIDKESKEKTNKIDDEGRKATLELYMNSRPPLEILEDLEKRVKEIIEK